MGSARGGAVRRLAGAGRGGIGGRLGSGWKAVAHKGWGDKSRSRLLGTGRGGEKRHWTCSPSGMKYRLGSEPRRRPK